MRRENKISIAILLFGFMAIGLYWFSENKVYSLENERVILTKEKSEFYKQLPLVNAYIEEIRKNLKNAQTILPLEESELDTKSKKVQAFLLQNREFLEDTISLSGQLLHNDMMTIRPAITSVLNAQSQKLCKKNTCYEAVKYNFVTNTTTRAIVHTDENKLLQLKRFKNMQPDISLRLRKIAQEIALNAPEIQKELGEAPSIKEMSMANVRGSLNNSPCENKMHLCVAPTFSYHDKEEALWAIVDLTDLKLSAAKWADLGKTATPSCISERSLQNREIMEKYCQNDTLHSEDDWKLSYRITASDGLEVIDASFKGHAVLKSAKIVDWHVAYEGKGEVSSSNDVVLAGRHVEFVKGEDKFLFGYNDAMGCPMFSTSVVLPFNAPRVYPLVKEGQKVGFYLVQDYRNPKWPMACNYRYENRFEFYDNGSFRVLGVNIGRGCGEKAIYRPVMRIDMDLGNETFYKYEGSWKKWLVEGQDLQSEARLYAKDKYLYKVQNAKGEGYYIEPNRGQFKDDSRGDNAKVFVTRFKEGEGDLDLLTLGSCCKLDEDGVERYLEERENIDAKDLVIWYVPKIQNDSGIGHEYCWADTILENGRLVVKEYPCVVGPKFVLIDQYQSLIHNPKL
ncbi:MAG: Unknown protein [uncultured Sulfurovum sp.]|uniref:Uncharacterized protein n=1 Tax=uncultured Sulfurovum sp. TaxID=269237 RepID=A0A6S6SRV6_9BACT|nr:MAG: Unknown protein [uncultured Sulfurovum sp.]